MNASRVIGLFGLFLLSNSSSSSEKCDQILHNNHQSICYNYEKKSAIKSTYLLNDFYVDSVNIKKRPGFRIDKRIPRKMASSSGDYANSGFDRGHILPDASADFDIQGLKQTYLMSNIVPQYRKTNRNHIFKIEKEERKLAVRDGMLLVTNYIIFKEDKGKLKNGQVIPSHFGKRLFNHRIEKCYLIGNDVWAKVQNISCKKLNK
jgi:endonuclease G, mitochondrial